MSDEQIRAHPAYADAVRAALWLVASTAVGFSTVLVAAAYLMLQDDANFLLVCLCEAPFLLFSVYLQLVGFRRDNGSVRAIGADARRVRQLATRDAWRQVFRRRRTA